MFRLYQYHGQQQQNYRQICNPILGNIKMLNLLFLTQSNSYAPKKWKCYIENHTSSFAPFVRRLSKTISISTTTKNGYFMAHIYITQMRCFIINVRLILRKIFIHIIYAETIVLTACAEEYFFKCVI